VGERDTIRSGCAGTRTVPFEAFTVTGNADGVAAGVDDDDGG
jgi:hypothetical protein